MMFTSAHVDIANPAGGVIRSYVARPVTRPGARPDGPGRHPAVLMYSDIFQLTGPMVRMVHRLAGHGFVVAAPEIYARIEPPGTVLDFERDRQRAMDGATHTPVAHFDADRRVVLDWLKAEADVDADKLAVAGFCIGGHLAFRGAFEPDVRATTCFYGTGIHSGKLGTDADAGSLARASEIQGELLMVWGRQDPHIPLEGRRAIHRALDDASLRWHMRTYDAEHAFMRDEGPRYDPESTDLAFAEMVSMFRRVLG
jgi:carboxymethylenebutenolidase